MAKRIPDERLGCYILPGPCRPGPLEPAWTLISSARYWKQALARGSRENHINPRTLRERLQMLEHEGAVKRIATPPSRQTWNTGTPKSKALNCIFEAVAEWGPLDEPER